MGGNVKNSFCLLMNAYLYYLSEVIEIERIFSLMRFCFILQNYESALKVLHNADSLEW